MVRVVGGVSLSLLLLLGGCGGDSGGAEAPETSNSAESTSADSSNDASVDNGATEEPLSSGVATSELYADISVVNGKESSSSVTAFASFREGGAQGALMVLSDDDVLEFDNSEWSKEMRPYDVVDELFDGVLGAVSGGIVSGLLGDLLGSVVSGELEDAIDSLLEEVGDIGIYSNTFYIDGENYKVSLFREAGVDASDNAVTLPMRFEIDSPVEGEQFRYDDEVTFVWANEADFEPEGNMRVSIFADCDFEGDLVQGFLLPRTVVEVEDNQLYTVSILDMIGVGSDRSLDCLLKAEFVRQVTGQLDPNLKGGQIIGKRIRTVEFEVRAD